MTFTDYLINFALIALVLLQIRDFRLSLRTLIRPVLGVSAAALYYMKGLPTSGNDVTFYVVLGAVGLVFGLGCAMTTHVWLASDGYAHARAGVLAAAFWILGIGSRLAFEEYSSHGGMGAITRFSIQHQITGENAWVAGLVIMAIAEVVSRLAVLRLRAIALTRSTQLEVARTSSAVAA